MAVERIREIRGTALPIRGDDIDTDRIIPARFLKSVSFDGLEAHLFEDDQRNLDAYRSAAIMLVNANFGCGSSREHAPQAIRRRGIRAVIGESFSEIFFGNSVALGLPCATAPRATIEALMAAVEQEPSLELVVNLDTLQVVAGGRPFAVALPAGARDSLLTGTWDATGILIENFDQVEAVAARLPYVNRTWPHLAS